jgi:hypothetical protein
MMFIAMLNPEPQNEREADSDNRANDTPLIDYGGGKPISDCDHDRDERHNADRERLMDEQISDQAHGPRFITSHSARPDMQAVQGRENGPSEAELLQDALQRNHTRA